MKILPWLASAVAENCALVLEAKQTRAEADAAVIAVIRKHPEFLDQLGAALGVRLNGRWISEHSASGDLFQTQMFPDLPAVMRVAPKKAVALADMTAADLDHAKNMLWNRTENQMSGAKEGAERERAAFSRLYDRVRPLLSGEKTVSEVLAELAAKDTEDGEGAAA